jgi:hypothetical protein
MSEQPRAGRRLRSTVCATEVKAPKALPASD